MIIPSQLTALVQRIRSRANWRSTPCLFIVSTGRTGTDTAIRILNSSDQISAFHEPHPQYREMTNEVFSNIGSRQKHYRHLFVKARRDLIISVAEKGQIYAESTIMKFFAPLIADTLPHAKFVHLVRHPGGVVRSGMRRGWYLSHPHDKWRLEPSLDDPIRSKWDNEWDRFEKICWYWSAINNFIINVTDHVEPSRSTMLRFEDLVAPGSLAYRQMFDLVGVGSPTYDVVQKILNFRHNEQETGDFPCFEQWSPEQKEKLLNIAGQMMQRLGYV